MHYRVEQFDFDPKYRLYSQEASTLQTPQVYGRLINGTIGITLAHNIGVAAEYVFTHADYDSGGEDIAGWVFSPSMQAVQQHPGLAGTRVLIIND